MDKNNIFENDNSIPMSQQQHNLPQENLLHIILRHRWIILSTTILFLAVAFIYILKVTPIYTSSARLYVEQSGPKIISEYKGLMTQSKNYLYTQSELMRSTPIVAKVADDRQIRRFKTFAGVDNRVGFIKKKLHVSVGERDDIISVSCNSPYPAEAAQIVNSVIDSYIDYHSAIKRSSVAEVLKIIQKEKLKRDKELSGKFKQLVDFTRENGIVSFDNRGGHVVFQKLSKLSEALTEAQLVTINAKASFEAAQNISDDPAKIKQFAIAQPFAGVHIFVNDAETQLRTELQRAHVELKNARYHCTEDHPSVQAIQNKISYLQEQIDQQAEEFADAYIEVMRLKWQTSQQRELELIASFEMQQQDAQDLGLKATEYSIIQSELKRTERLCEILDDRIKELNVTEDVRPLNISILEVARPATTPSKPQKTKIMAMALIFGLMFGCGFAVLRDWLDYRLRSVEEILAILNIPVLGVVPTMPGEHAVVNHGQRVWLKIKPIIIKAYKTIRVTVLPDSAESQTELANTDLTEIGIKPEQESLIERGQKVRSEFKSMGRKSYRTIRANVFSDMTKKPGKDISLTPAVVADIKDTVEKPFMVERGQKVHLEPKSIVAEAYRTIRTAVFFGVPQGGAKLILVTSPAPGDGKSTLVSNLAITMAQAGQKTLILDCDFRKPVQHKIFEISNPKGLTSVLAGATTLSEAIEPGPVKGLDILPCGYEVPNPSEILNSNLFARALKGFSERYDRVIIDSPPVAPVADSQILAAICDVTILVLRAEKSTRRLSQQACDSLLSVGGNLLGAIVNDVPRRHGRYGYYSGYGHYGGYGDCGYYGETEKKPAQTISEIKNKKDHVQTVDV